MTRDRRRGSCGKKVLNHQLFIGHLQFVERKHLHAALCSNWVQSFTAARKLHRWLSTSGITTPLKNGTMKPPGSSQGDGRDV
jgi:hypothetical protein